MRVVLAAQSGGNRSAGWAALSRGPRQWVLLTDLWVRGAGAFSGYRAGDTCASPERGESTEGWKASVSQPSCSGVWVTPKAHKLPAPADPMRSDSAHDAAHAS